MNTKNPVKKIGASLLITLALVALVYLLLPNGRSVGAAPQLQPPGTSSKALAASVRADQKRMRMALGQLPLSFEMNRGQFDPQVQFASRGAGYKAFLTQSETVFVLRKPTTSNAPQPTTNLATKAATQTERVAEAAREREERAAQRAASKAVVRMSFAGANAAPTVTGLDEMAGKINYFRGNNEQKWITDVPTFRRVSYTDIYPGINLIYYGKGRDLEYDLVIGPGADPNQIGFNFDGAERVEVDAATGSLVIHALGGAQLRQAKPLIYQEVDGVRRAVSGGFTATGNRAGFAVGDYDRSRPLVIDPAIISYSSYLGGENNDRGHDIAADGDGNAYVVGWTESEAFPTKNAYQPGNNNDSDEAFVTKFNPDGSQLIWSTYLGGGISNSEGSPGDGAYGVALDADRNVYVTGYTFSVDFPVQNAMQPHQSDAGCCGFSDSFITKLNAAGNQLVFSTYFGGADGDDVGRGIAVDNNNNVYVVGYTDSFVFPTTNPIQGEIDGRTTHFHNGENFDAYLAKIDASGQFRVYSTYIGGNLNDVAVGVKVDREGNAYVTGWTESTQTPPLFPTTSGAFQTNPGGNGSTRDAFVTKVDAAGTQFLYSTFLGGNGTDTAWGIALGTDGSAYVTGYTNSGNLTRDAATGPSQAITQDSFPTTANAFQKLNAGGFDAFLTRLSPDGSSLIYSTYIGGAANEGDASNVCLSCAALVDGAAVAVDLLGNAYITGWTESTFVPAPPGPGSGPAVAPVNFPTKDAFQPNPGSSPGSSPPNSRDAFVSMFDTNKSGNDSLVYSSFLGGSRQDEGEGIAVDPGGNVYVTGWTKSDSASPQGATAPEAVGANDFPTSRRGRARQQRSALSRPRNHAADVCRVGRPVEDRPGQGRRCRQERPRRQEPVARSLVQRPRRQPCRRTRPRRLAEEPHGCR